MEQEVSVSFSLKKEHRGEQTTKKNFGFNKKGEKKIKYWR